MAARLEVAGGREEPVRALLDALPDAMVVSDTDGRIVAVNSLLEELSGYTAGELVGEHVDVLVPDRYRARHRADRSDYGAAGRPPRAMGTGPETSLRRRDGEEVPVDIALSTIRGDAGTLVLSAVRDATRRRRPDERLIAVNEVSRAILDNQPIDAVFHIIAARSRVLVHASAASIVTPDDRDDTLIERVADGRGAALIDGLRFAAAGSISAQVMDSRESLVLEDLSADPRALRPIVRAVAAGPALFAPLAVADHSFGALFVARTRGSRPFDRTDRRMIELFASQAAIALEHARYQEELHLLAVLEDRERISREIHDGTIQALFATGMKLQSTLGAISGEPALRVDDAIEAIDRVITDLRGYIFGLRAEAAARGDTTDTLYRLSHELRESAGVETVADIEPAAVVAAKSCCADELVQLVREALSNVGRHASATTCRLLVTRTDDAVIVEIDDDGDGFHLEERLGRGRGLTNLRERAASLGATLEIDTAPGRGTTVRVAIPR